MTRFELTRKIQKDLLDDSVKKGVNSYKLASDLLLLVDNYYLSRIQEETTREFVSMVYDESPDFPEGS